MKGYWKILLILMLAVGFASCEDDQGEIEYVITGRAWTGDVGMNAHNGEPLFSTFEFGNDGFGVETQFYASNGLLYDQFHLITFRKALKKIHLMGKLCPHFIGILYLCPDLFLCNFQNTAKIRSAALIADADFLPCLHAQHMTDMIDITAHNADPILLHLFIFHKKLVHTLLLLFLCGNIYPLTLMIDFHYSKSCCFYRFFYFVFLKINDAGSDKITTLF